MKHLLILVLFLVSLCNANAQESDTIKRNKKTLEALFVNIINEYQRVPKSKNKENYLNFFSKKYIVNRIQYGIDGEMVVKNNDYNDLEKMLNIVTTLNGFETQVKIDKIIEVFATPNRGFVMARLNFKTKRDGEDYMKGSEIHTYFFEKKSEAEWHVISAQSIQIRDFINKHTCSCQVARSQAKDNAYTVNIEVPEGTFYAKHLHYFTFDNQDGVRIVDIDGAKVNWLGNGELQLLNKGFDLEKGASLGKGSKPGDAMIAVMRTVYKKRCTNVVIKDK